MKKIVLGIILGLLLLGMVTAKSCLLRPPSAEAPIVSESQK
ncbi:MAG: hypothetical protein PHV06_01610 [bacterium]|nr:hypothetical protein [bacterium]